MNKINVYAIVVGVIIAAFGIAVFIVVCHSSSPSLLRCGVALTFHASYEIRTQGDSFVLAFRNPLDAAKYCMVCACERAA